MADLPINTLIYGSQVRPAVGPVVQPNYAPVPMPDPRRQAQAFAAPPNAVATATDTGGNGFFDNLTAGFSDPLTLMGMQMIGNGGMSVGQPRQMFQGVPQTLEAAQGMKLREEQAQQKRAEQEAEAERKRLLAETIIPQLPANLQALAQVDPEGALAIYQQTQPKPLDYGWQNIDGQLIRTDSAGNATPMGQFGNQPRPMTQEERTAWGISPDDPNAYALDDKGFPKALGAGGITVNNNMSGDKFGDAFGSELGKQQAALIDAGRTAASNNIRLGQLESHLANAQQGATGGLVQLAGQFGLPVQGLDDIQAAQAIINQMVPNQRPPGSGTMSDADLALYKASLPSIMNQPGGNAYIIQTTKAINEYYVEQGRIAEELAIGRIDLATAMEMQRSVPNPLADITRNMGGEAATAPAQGGTAPQITTQQEYDALPAGSVYIAPDGQQRTKR
jgi:hypothetical protein